MIERAEPIVLALWFNTRGANYVLFEGIYAPVDWGKRGRKPGDKPRDVEQIASLLDLHRPAIVVLQDCADPLLHCPRRVIELVSRSMQLAGERHINIYQYGREQIRSCFAYHGARSKDEIAREIANQLPVFSRYVPPMRRLWMSEDHRMGMFDALALMFTYFRTERLKQSSTTPNT